MTDRRKIIAVPLLALLVVLGSTAESVKGCSGSAGSSSSSTPEHEGDYREWCRHVVQGDPSTYVYRWHRPGSGKSGYIKGRDAADRHRTAHPNDGLKRIC